MNAPGQVIWAHGGVNEKLLREVGFLPPCPRCGRDAPTLVWHKDKEATRDWCRANWWKFWKRTPLYIRAEGYCPHCGKHG